MLRIFGLWAPGYSQVERAAKDDAAVSDSPAEGASSASANTVTLGAAAGNAVMPPSPPTATVSTGKAKPGGKPTAAAAPVADTPSAAATAAALVPAVRWASGESDRGLDSGDLAGLSPAVFDLLARLGAHTTTHRHAPLFTVRASSLGGGDEWLVAEWVGGLGTGGQGG